MEPNEKKAVKKPGIVTIDLAQPIKIDGRDVEKIDLDFNRVTGNAIMNIESEMRGDGEVVPQNAMMSSTYCLYIGARAAGLNIADFRTLGYRDTMQIVQAVQNFSAGVMA